MSNWRLWVGLTALALVGALLGFWGGQFSLGGAALVLSLVFWLVSLLQPDRPKGYRTISLVGVLLLFLVPVLIPLRGARPRADIVALQQHAQRLYVAAVTLGLEPGAKPEEVIRLLEGICASNQASDVEYKGRRMAFNSLPPSVEITHCAIQSAGDDFEVELRAKRYGTFKASKDGVEQP